MRLLACFIACSRASLLDKDDICRNLNGQLSSLGRQASCFYGIWNIPLNSGGTVQNHVISLCFRDSDCVYGIAGAEGGPDRLQIHWVHQPFLCQLLQLGMSCHRMECVADDMHVLLSWFCLQHRRWRMRNYNKFSSARRDIVLEFYKHCRWVSTLNKDRL